METKIEQVRRREMIEKKESKETRQYRQREGIKFTHSRDVLNQTRKTEGITGGKHFNPCKQSGKQTEGGITSCFSFHSSVSPADSSILGWAVHSKLEPDLYWTFMADNDIWEFKKPILRFPSKC